MKVTIIGSGNFSSKNGASSIMITNESEPTILNLFDCGDTVFRELLQITDGLKDIETVNVFITHNHADHIGSLASLILYCQFVKNLELNIYAKDVTLIPNIMESQEAHRMNGIPNYYELIEPEYSKIKLFGKQSGEYLTIFNTTHTKLDSIGFYIYVKDNPNPVLCFTGDIADVPTHVIRNVKAHKTLTFIDCDLGAKPSNVHTHYNDLINLFNKDDSIIPIHYDIEKLPVNPKLKFYANRTVIEIKGYDVKDK